MAWIALLLGVVVARPQTATPAPPAAINAPAAWRQFRLNGAHNAVVPGELRVSWRIETGGAFSASPTLHDGSLFIGNNNGRLLALDPSNGAIRWTNQFAASLMAAPVALNGMLVVGEGDQVSYRPRGSASTVVGMSTNALVALDAATGGERWRYNLDGTGMPTAALIGATLVHHDGAGAVVGIDAHSGTRVFTSSIGSFASMSAALPVDGTSFVTTGEAPNAIYRIDATNGRIMWQHQFAASTSGVGDCPPARDHDRAFCDYLAPVSGTAQPDVGDAAQQHVYGIELRDGSLAWDTALDAGAVPKWNEAAIPLVYNGRVYVGSAIAPRVCALDARTGARAWCTTVRGAVKGGIVAVGDVLYFGDLGGYLWALDARDGSVVGVRNAGTPFNVASPIVVGRTLIVGSQTGTLLAMPLDEIRTANDPDVPTLSASAPERM